jgi:hypothetical protein
MSSTAMHRTESFLPSSSAQASAALAMPAGLPGAILTTTITTTISRVRLVVFA